MSDEQWELVTDREYVPRPGVDEYRLRYVGDDARWTEWGAWGSVTGERTIGEWLDQSRLRDWQFRRPRHVEPQPQQADDEFEPLPIEDDTYTQCGRDQARWRGDRGGIWSEWSDLQGKSVSLTWFVEQRPDDLEWEFRRRKQWPVEVQPQPLEPEQPVLSAGSKYKRLVRQTLPDGHIGASVVVDVYDVLRAWDVTCPALQHAVKKLLQPGQRGAKSAVQDLREAIGSIERAIQLMSGG